jgi:nicotinamidase-related amidase
VVTVEMQRGVIGDRVSDNLLKRAVSDKQVIPAAVRLVTAARAAGVRVVHATVALRAPVPPGDRWALRHLPFYGRWYRLIMSFSGIAAGTDPYRIDPEHHDPSGRPVNAGNAQRADALLAWMRSIVGDRPDLLD